MKKLKLTNHDNRPPSGHDSDLRVPADLTKEELDTMPYIDIETMLWFSDRWWWFPTASTDLYSAEFEWRDDRLYLLEPDGSAVEGLLFVGEVELV